jgi:L-arabinonolactonase
VDLMQGTAELAVDARNWLGEGVLWCDRTQAVWWTDINGATLWRRAADGQVAQWPMPERLGCLALCDDDRLLLGLASGVALFDPATSAMSTIVPVDSGEPTARINDGRCDRQGRFVFGLFNPAERPVCHFYRVGPGLQVERLPLPPAGVANSIAFSPDGATMYFTDSPRRVIWSVAYGADGALGTPRTFVEVPGPGAPDGSCVDADGGLWNAQWDGGCVVRYDAQGRETARIAVPVSRPTCPALGGPALDQLYITSARVGLDAQRLAQEPQAGGLFVAQAAWRGLPESRFRTRA